MKLAIQESLRQRAALGEDELQRLGFRGVEVPAHLCDATLNSGLKPCILDSLTIVGENAAQIDLATWDRWFTAAHAAGAQGVAAAVRLRRGDPDGVEAYVDRLSALAWKRGSRLLLTIRTEEQSAPVASYTPLIAWCRQRDGRGLGLILDTEAAVRLGDVPRRLLREAEGYVQHVRVPSPAWNSVPEAAIVGVLQELQRISYIDYVALHESGTEHTDIGKAIDALRQAVVAAWS